MSEENKPIFDTKNLLAKPCSVFSVRRRNYGHWDIWDNEARIFAIRGGPGRYFVRDERSMHKRGQSVDWPEFKTLGMIMSAICEELMYENLAVEGHPPHEIESWNI